MCEVQLPKIWTGRIQKYWDKIMPSNYPQSSSVFSTKFESQEIKDAVDDFEKKLGTSESVVIGLLPNGTAVSNYIGVYDVVAEPGELTLLSPEKVTTDNVLVMHYVDGAWVKVENIQIKDGYVWGTLDSFSPIAMCTYVKDIHQEDTIDGLPTNKGKYVVCEGLSTKIETVDGVIKLTASTGTSINLTEKMNIIGGSVDGRHIDKTDINVVGVNNKDIIAKIIGGSFYYTDDENPVSATVDEINITIIDSTVGGITGASGMVRVNQVNTTLTNSTASWTGCGESWMTAKNKDCNKPNCSFASLAWVKDSLLVLNESNCELPYASGNSGYLYVDHNETIVNGGTIGYLITGGSNGCTKEGNAVCKDATIGIYQSTNRGNVVTSTGTFTNCKVAKLFIGGDATDSTVTGTTESIRVDINAGTDDLYNILPGVEAGTVITADVAANIVNAVKVSRSANVVIDDTTKAILGTKYVVK